MKKIEKTAGGANFAAVTVGKMDELNQHTLILAPGVEIPGKVFTTPLPLCENSVFAMQ